MSAATLSTLMPASRTFGSATSSHLEARRDVDTERLRRGFVNGLLFRLHDVGERSVARLVETKVGGDHRGARQQQRLEAAVDLAHNADLAVGEFYLRGESSLRPAEQTGEHLTRLIAVVVDRLLAHDDEIDAFVLDHALQELGDAERLDHRVGLDQDGAVGTHGERGAQRVLRLYGTDRDRDDLAGLAALLDADRLLDGDFVEGVHRHLDVGKVDAAAVRFDADLDVVVDDPFDRDQNLHAAILSRTCFAFPPNPALEHVISQVRNGPDRTAGNPSSQGFRGFREGSQAPPPVRSNNGTPRRRMNRMRIAPAASPPIWAPQATLSSVSNRRLANWARIQKPSAQ